MIPLALAILMFVAVPPAVAGWPAAVPSAIQAQQSASGLVIAEDVAGRVTVFDTAQRMVFARQLFNDTVGRYNEAARQFPTRLVSSLFGFGVAGTL